MPKASRDQRVRVVLSVGMWKGFACSPRPYMFELDGKFVLTRRYWGSKMREWPAVVNNTSWVEALEIENENGEVV